MEGKHGATELAFKDKDYRIPTEAVPKRTDIFKHPGDAFNVPENRTLNS